MNGAIKTPPAGVYLFHHFTVSRDPPGNPAQTEGQSPVLPVTMFQW